MYSILDGMSLDDFKKYLQTIKERNRSNDFNVKIGYKKGGNEMR